MRFFIIWALRVNGNDKIPNEKREQESFLQWASDRHSGLESPLKKCWRLPWNELDLLFKYGCYILVQDDDYEASDENHTVTKVLHVVSSTTRSLPDAVNIYKKDILNWQFVSNHNDVLTQIVNSDSGVSFFMKKLFPEVAEGLASTPLEVPINNHDCH